MNEQRVFIVAGEASGDQHAAHLVKSLTALHPSWSFVGFGGPALQAAGVELRVDLVDQAVMGIRKVVAALGSIVDVAALFWEELRDSPPDLVILVDYPGLNLNLARMAKRRGIPVAYYIVPQVWAWGPWRVRRVARRADLLLVILPFEKDIYARHHDNVEYVGNPLYEELRTRELEWGGQRSEQSIHEPTVALFPGSRVHEVEETLPTMLRIARTLRQRDPSLVFRVSCHRQKLLPVLERCLSSTEADGLDLEVVTGDSRALQRAAGFSLVVSGTITLEHAFFGTPMVVLYPVTPWEQRLFRALSVTPFIALVNLVAGRQIVPEYLFVPHREERAPTEAAIALLGGTARLQQHRSLRALREGEFGVDGVQLAAQAVSRFVERQTAQQRP